jgi:hypothetical protein
VIFPQTELALPPKQTENTTTIPTVIATNGRERRFAVARYRPCLFDSGNSSVERLCRNTLIT